MNTTQKLTGESPSAGYYSMTLRLASGKRILRSNNERAFVISQLQDLLGRRSLLEEPDTRHTLASHIDLLAFSILDKEIQCIVFAIAQNSARKFAEIIMNRLSEYQSEWQLAPSFRGSKYDTRAISMTRLAGPHDALQKSVQLHLRHSDWEYDRYSSIGFYLHDRRGDWMHIWRLTNLYENDVSLYYELIGKTIPFTKYIGTSSITTRPYVPLSHAL